MSMRIMVIVAVLCSLGTNLAAAIAGSSTSETAPVVEIKGRVTDQTSAPVSGALVEWGSIFDAPGKRLKTTTDTDGRYTLRITRYDQCYRLGFSAKGFAPVWFDYSPPWAHYHQSSPEPTPPQNTDVVLEPAHYVEGVVVDEKRQPIPGASVEARTAVEGFHSSFSSPSSPTAIPGCENAQTTTGADGKFRFENLPAKHVNLSVQAIHRHVNDANYKVDGSHTIVMCGSGRPGKVLAQAVNAQTSKPVTSYVLAQRYSAEQQEIANEYGGFEVPGFPTEGSKPWFYIYAKDYLPWGGRLLVMPLDHDGTATIALSPGPPLRGKLLDADTKQPVISASVLFGVAPDVRYFEWGDYFQYCDGRHAFSNVQRAVTNKDGSFWFCENPDQRGTLVVNTPGYERALIPPDKRLGPDADGVVPVLVHREASIHGVVYQEDGDGTVGVSLWQDQPRPQIEWFWERTPVNADGSFMIGRLPAGEYHLSVVRLRTSPGRETAHPLTTVTVSAGKQKELGRLTPSKQPQ